MAPMKLFSDVILRVPYARIESIEARLALRPHRFSSVSGKLSSKLVLSTFHRARGKKMAQRMKFNSKLCVNIRCHSLRDKNQPNMKKSSRVFDTLLFLLFRIHRENVCDV